MTYATPRWLMAIGEMLDRQAFIIKSKGAQERKSVARALRQIADILDQEI